MFPVLLRIGPITIYTYGLFAIFALVFGLFIVWKRGRELHFVEDQLMDAVFRVALWVFLGARLFYVLLHWDKFGLEIWNWFNVISYPGFELIGGLIGMLFGSVRQSGERRWDVFSLLDILVTAMAFMQILLSLGAFFNGSGVGVQTSLFFGVRFPGLFDQRHPVQLYEALLYLCLFILLWWLEYVYRTIGWYKGRRSEAQSGFIFSTYLIGYSLIALTTSLLKESSGMVGGLWIINSIRVGLLLSGVWLIYSRAGTKIMWAEVAREWVNDNVVLPIRRARRRRRQRDATAIQDGIE